MNRIMFGIDHLGSASQSAYIQVPKAMRERGQETDEDWHRVAQKASVIGPVLIDEMVDGSWRIGFDFPKIGRRRHPINRRNDLIKVIDIVNGIQIAADEDEVDDRLRVAIGGIYPDHQRYGMQAEVQLPDPANPDLADQAVSNLVTSSMQAAANQLRYLRPEFKRAEVDELVGGNIDRRFGVSIIAHTSGSSTLDSDGNEFGSDAETISLYDHNLYSREQQLICFTGVVALAHADTLI